MRSPRIVLIAILLFAADAASAQDLPAVADSVYSLEEITVTATRAEASAAVVSQRVTVLGAGDIEAAGSRTLAELLSRRSNLFVRHYGQGLATASTRGSTPSQSLLMIDGMRLSDPQLGQFDLSLLPTHLIGAVEVLHGPSSALYGSDGISGAVNIRPVRARDDHASLRTLLGAYGERAASGSAAVSGPNWSVAASGEFAQSEGDFPYMDEALFPPREVRRKNADRGKRSAYASAEHRRGSHHLRGSVLVIRGEQGLPGLAAGRPVGERQWDDHLRLWVEDGIRLGSGAMRVRGFVHRSAIRYTNPFLGLDATGRAFTAGMEGEGRLELQPGTTVTGGISGGYATADHPSLSEQAREYSTAGFVSGAATRDRLRVYPALRLDLYRPEGRDARWSLAPRIGTNLQPIDGVPLFLKTHIGRGFRIPTFNDRFWQPGGNPDLKPERSWSYEAGVFVDGPADLEATVFSSYTKDQLTWTPRAGGIWAPENLSRSKTTGVEASLRVVQRTGFGQVEAGLFYTWTRAVDRSDPDAPVYGRQLRYVPRQQAKGNLALQVKAFTIGFNAGYVGRRYVTSDESEWVDAAFVLDARATLTRDVGRIRARLSVDVENVGDVQYEIINNYPMPPRHARVALQIQTKTGKEK